MNVTATSHSTPQNTISATTRNKPTLLNDLAHICILATGAGVASALALSAAVLFFASAM
jgi:hypothetical protein